MFLRIYIDSVSPAHKIDEIQLTFPATAGATIPLDALITRAIRSSAGSFAPPTPGPHTFLFTLQPDPADVANGNTVQIPAQKAEIVAMQTRNP